MTVRNLTDFQIRCELRLSGALRQIGGSISGRMLNGQGEPYVSGGVSDSDLEFWIYEDGADFKSSRGSKVFEELDFGSLDDLAEAFIASVLEAVQ